MIVALAYHTALIVGAGSGISAAVARALAAEGVRLGLAARSTAKLAPLATEFGAECFAADASDPDAVESLFAAMESRMGAPDVVVFTPSARVRGSLLDLDPAQVRRALEVTAFGGFLVARQAARRMVPKRHGALLFTGASASVKGFAGSAAFAMGKFALRGLAQSAARELGPHGIHVAHVVIDGAVRTAPDDTDATLDPAAIAQTYVDLLRQPRSAWSLEVELRPFVERF
jgi:NAD(P)-dependent dehydrogenase (short-subunit alcohol dehydrogenase family)